MQQRPDYISAIGYLLVMGGAMGLLLSICCIGTHDEPPAFLHVDETMVWAGLIAGGCFSTICLISGTHILNGRNWARWLYTLGCAALFIFDFYFLTNSLYKFAITLIIRFTVVIFLFLPGANRFFRNRSRW